MLELAPAARVSQTLIKQTKAASYNDFVYGIAGCAAIAFLMPGDEILCQQAFCTFRDPGLVHF
jgi:hypothetical protein